MVIELYKINLIFREYFVLFRINKNKANVKINILKPIIICRKKEFGSSFT